MLLIFDLDGTIFRTETVDFKAINRALALHGYEEKTVEEILSLTNMPIEEAAKVFLGTDDRVEVEKFVKDATVFEVEEIYESGMLYEGALEFLQRIRSMDCKVCLCSNGSKEYVDAVVDKFGLEEFFDEIWADTEGYTKKDAVKLLKEKFNADRFIVVGDRSVDIDAAKENGGIAIGVTYGFGGDEPYSAHYTVHSLAEVEECIKKIFADFNKDNSAKSID